MEKILILDFGSQTTQLIARRIRESGVYSDIVNGTSKVQDLDMSEVKGIILSGSPASVYESNAPLLDENIFQLPIPILGICYGMHRIILDFGGHVEGLYKKEYGRSKVQFSHNSPLFKNVPENFVSWMSHGDSISQIPINFFVIASSEDHIAAISHKEKEWYGIQFHPEVSHCEYGTKILSNFAREICGAKPSWNMDYYLESMSSKIKGSVKDGKVLVLISGGVDSTVAAGLVLNAVPREHVYLLYIDTGLMRKNETKEVMEELKKLGAVHLYWIDAAERFLHALNGVDDPEKKREIIGDLFITLQEEEVSKLGIKDAFLVQGTLYTDLIESGKGVGSHAKVIKSHHNVRSPLIEEKRKWGEVIEPLSYLYKDEVRTLGEKLGISSSTVRRHPFPGPGLAVRILGEVTYEKCDILRNADAILLDELKKRDLYNDIWQAFTVLLPIRSVGVTGDMRKYGWVLAIRCVSSFDGMTADVYPFPMNDLLEISSKITNTVPDIGRVVYDVSSKPPSTIEWE